MNRKVVVARASASLESAASTMSRRRVSGVPVVDKSRRVVGVLSQKDIVRVLREQAGLSLPGGVFDLVLGADQGGRAELHERCLATLKRTTVGAAMSREPATLPADATMDRAVRLMVDSGFNRVPVVRNGKLVGIVTRTDLLTASAAAK
jgi:CBS domain-containing protein